MYIVYILYLLGYSYTLSGHSLEVGGTEGKETGKYFFFITFNFWRHQSS